LGFKNEGNCYVHNLLLAADQVVIAGGVEDANYIGRKLEEEYEKWGLIMNYGKTEYFRYRSFGGIANQWEYNFNCKAV
jgi:hypothetical protein